MNNIKFNDFKNICRACLLKCDLKFTRNYFILDVYYKLTDTCWDLNDELPQQICQKCYEKINEFRTFSLQCKQSQTSLKDCLNEFKNAPIQEEQETIEITNVQETDEITIEEHKIKFEELYLPNNSVTDGLQIKPEHIDEFEVIIPELNINSLQDVSFNENVKNEEITDGNANQNDHHFKCYICTEIFKSSTDLNRHKRIHTNEYSFSCEFCNKKFKSSSALKGHKRVHSNEPPFECDASPNMEFLMSQKNKPVLIYSGFEFLHFRTRDDIIIWRCRENRSFKCHSLMKTQNKIVIQQPSPHCHDSCPQKLEATKARNMMKDGIKAIGATPKTVIGNVLSKVNNDVITYLPKQSSLVRNLLNYKKSKIRKF